MSDKTPSRMGNKNSKTKQTPTSANKDADLPRSAFEIMYEEAERRKSVSETPETQRNEQYSLDSEGRLELTPAKVINVELDEDENISAPGKSSNPSSPLQPEAVPLSNSNETIIPCAQLDPVADELIARELTESTWVDADGNYIIPSQWVPKVIHTLKTLIPEGSNYELEDISGINPSWSVVGYTSGEYTTMFKHRRYPMVAVVVRPSTWDAPLLAERGLYIFFKHFDHGLPVLEYIRREKQSNYWSAVCYVPRERRQDAWRNADLNLKNIPIEQKFRIIPFGNVDWKMTFDAGMRLTEDHLRKAHDQWLGYVQQSRGNIRKAIFGSVRTLSLNVRYPDDPTTAHLSVETQDSTDAQLAQDRGGSNPVKKVTDNTMGILPAVDITSVQSFAKSSIDCDHQSEEPPSASTVVPDTATYDPYKRKRTPTAYFANTPDLCPRMPLKKARTQPTVDSQLTPFIKTQKKDITALTNIAKDTNKTVDDSNKKLVEVLKKVFFIETQLGKSDKAPKGDKLAKTDLVDTISRAIEPVMTKLRELGHKQVKLEAEFAQLAKSVKSDKDNQKKYTWEEFKQMQMDVVQLNASVTSTHASQHSGTVPMVQMQGPAAGAWPPQYAPRMFHMGMTMPQQANYGGYPGQPSPGGSSATGTITQNPLHSATDPTASQVDAARTSEGAGLMPAFNQQGNSSAGMTAFNAEDMMRMMAQIQAFGAQQAKNANK